MSDEKASLRPAGVLIIGGGVIGLAIARAPKTGVGDVTPQIEADRVD